MPIRIHNNLKTNWFERNSLIIILIITAILSLYNISHHDLQEWDESRNGVNALEMLKNHDYINYYYNGQLDTWNAKPPLMIWLIAASYKLWGINEFALRFPSIIASLIILLMCFKTINLFESRTIAAFTCIILISSKALLGDHIGITGDFDALLTMFLIASVYYFLLFVEKKKQNAIYLVAIFTGFAFYTKGTASFIFIPSFVLYLIFKKKLKSFIQFKAVWLSMLLLLLIISTWLLLVANYGLSSNKTAYGTNNSIETMLIHDTFNRLTNEDFGVIRNKNRFFIIEVLDTRLNLWNYLFYLSLALGIYKVHINQKSVLEQLKDDDNSLTIIALCIIIPLSLLLTIATSKHSWYLAPVFMFVAFIISKGVYYLTEEYKWFKVIIASLVVFTFIRHADYLLTQPTINHLALSSNDQLQNMKVYTEFELSQDIQLYLEWLNCEIVRNEQDWGALKGQLIIVDRLSYDDRIDVIQHCENYFIGRVK